MLNLPVSGGFDTSSVISGGAFFESNIPHPVYSTGSESNTNAVFDVVVVSRTTAGVAASGLGVGVLLLLENAAGTTRAEGGRMAAKWIDAVAPVQSELVFSVHTAGRGSVDEVFRISTGLTFAPFAETDGARKTVLITPANHTGQTASTEISGFDYVTHTRTWAAGAITTQREFLIEAPTYAFDGASTISTAATLAVSGAPIVGANASITTPLSLWTQNGVVRHDVDDAVTATVTDVVVINHTSTGAPAANFGVGILLRGEDASGTAGGDDMARIQAVWTTATSGAESSRIDLQVRQGGAALATVASFQSASGSCIVPSAYRIGTTTSSEFLISASANVASYNVATSTFTHQFGQSTAASSGARKFFVVTPIANTAQTLSTEINCVHFNLSATRQWATGALATQREVLWQAPTYGFVGASTITTSIFMDIDGAPTAGTNATITNSFGVRVGAAGASIGPTSASMLYATIAVPAHTATVTGATNVTTATSAFSALSLGIVTVSDGSAVTITNAATLYIAGAPVGGGAGPATITNMYALWVDAGRARFDGDGTHVFEIDADTAAPGAATGKIPFKDTSTGGTRYIMVSDT